MPNPNETIKTTEAIDRAKMIFQKKKEKFGRELYYFIETFGCQMNAKDSEKLAGILEEIGYREAEAEEEADFILYNTCTVRENANDKVYGRIGYLNSLRKKEKPHLVVAMCGCMMQEKDEVEKIRKTYPCVRIVFGTYNVYDLANLWVRQETSGKRVFSLLDGSDEIVENLPAKRKYPFKSGVNIMYGCNNFCSYCIVPYVRGREKSREPKEILREIEKLTKDGVKEIMLLGQNVNSYGKTLENPVSFASLLRQIEKVEGLERIRFMTSHPKDLSDELIETLKNSKKICHHFHLPLQSGSNKVLKEMNRHYTKEKFLELVRKLREAVPDMAISTDIIVGFPGETEEDFQETLDVVEKSRFESAFTFIYSPRTGTPAAKRTEDFVPDRVVKDRFARLLSLVQKISSEEMEKKKGKKAKILVEEKNSQDESMVTGRMSDNTLVHIKGDDTLIGREIEVKLTECKGFYFIGEALESR